MTAAKGQELQRAADAARGQDPVPASPYSGLPDRQFWKLGVAGHDLASISDIYTKRFSLDGLKIAAAGSCFAQHITRSLQKRGYTVIDKEPPPRGLRGASAQRFGYDLYSARHGNIYSVRQLLQLAQEALGSLAPKPDDYIWSKDGRYFDALRPSVEPEGLPSREEVMLQRADHLRRFRDVLDEADLFVFTFGLTEAWRHKPTGLVYATPPGTIAGRHDPSIHEFKNFRFQEIYDDFVAFRELAHSRNANMKFLVTVSPVPLTATASDAHVLTATIRSKSILRAVASQLYDDLPDLDYFPSYELLSTPFLGEPMFEDNKRSVSSRGVAEVMRVFFGEHAEGGVQPVKPANPSPASAASEEDVVCEESLLEAFAPKK